jgi:hypothetical protein
MAEQDGRAAAHDRPDRFAHLRVEREAEAPLRILDHPIQGAELVHADGAHDVPFVA